MKFSNIVALCGFILFATSSMQTSAVSTGSYFLGNHPDGNIQPPLYGMRLDGLLGHANYTFDFDNASSGMRLDWNESTSTIHIYGKAFGGFYDRFGYRPGSTAVWDIDFTYNVGVTTVANGGVDDVVVTGNHNNFGTLSSSKGSFELRSHSDVSSTFNLGDETGLPPWHRGFDGISGWGWLDYSSDGGSTWAGSDGGCCSDWLFTMTPVPVPAAVWLFGSGLVGLIGVARRRIQ